MIRLLQGVLPQVWHNRRRFRVFPVPRQVGLPRRPASTADQPTAGRPRISILRQSVAVSSTTMRAPGQCLGTQRHRRRPDDLAAPVDLHRCAIECGSHDHVGSVVEDVGEIAAALQVGPSLRHERRPRFLPAIFPGGDAEISPRGFLAQVRFVWVAICGPLPPFCIRVAVVAPQAPWNTDELARPSVGEGWMSGDDGDNS